MLQLASGAPPTLVMFDLDGTLVDSVPDLAWAIDQMLLRLELPQAGIEKVRHWIGNGARVLVRRALVDCAQSQAQALEESALALFMQLYAQAPGLTCVYPGVHESLQALAQQGIAMALITNKPERFLPGLLAEFDLAPYFSWVIGGDTFAAQKPDPLALLHVLEHAGVLAEQALFVGDSRNDVFAARAAGVAVAAVTYGYNHGEPVAELNPDWLWHDLREILRCNHPVR